MENFMMYDLPSWALENEDFPLGAKATPFLPSATEFDVAPQNDKFELPEWMESREVLGLENTKPFEGTGHPSNFVEKYDEINVEENQIPSIKPEDMLVPLSTLQPQSTPQDVIANLAPHTLEPTPKIIICKKVVHYEDGSLFEIQHDNTDNPQVSSDAFNAAENCKQEPDSVTKSVEGYGIPASGEISSGKFDADKWIDEMYQMIGKDSGDASFASTELVECDMDDLLSQLESTDSQLELSETYSWGSEPASPVSLPSPVPSVGYLSPHQASQESLFVSLLSPSVTEEYNDNLGAQSYAQSHLKRKVCSKSSVCKVPCPQNHKEQEKEQNELTGKYIQKDISSWESEPASPVSLPSPVPVGNLSPHKVPHESLASSILSPSVTEDYNNDLGAHSYSRSPLKKRFRSKSSARKVPYPENRKERKKEQNKQAALRYRQKKKQEEDDLISRIESEEKRQDELKKKHAGLKQELQYLKKLMREVFIAKGVISADALKKK